MPGASGYIGSHLVQRFIPQHLLGFREAVEAERRLSLSFGMQAPGAGMLEFELEPLKPGEPG